LVALTDSILNPLGRHQNFPSGKVLVAPEYFSWNQILQDIENIFKFKDLAPLDEGATLPYYTEKITKEY